RRRLIAVMILGGCSLFPSSLEAGIYYPGETELWLPPKPAPNFYPLPKSFHQFATLLGDLRSLAVENRANEVGESLRSHYLKRIAELNEKEKHQSLTIDDRLALSACYLRVLKDQQGGEAAIRVLGPAEAADRGNFMVLANLAIAHYMAGILD